MEFVHALSQKSWHTYNIKSIVKDILRYSGYFGDCNECTCIEHCMNKEHKNCLRNLVKEAHEFLDKAFNEDLISSKNGICEHLRVITKYIPDKEQSSSPKAEMFMVYDGNFGIRLEEENGTKVKNVILELNCINCEEYHSDCGQDDHKLIDYDKSLLENINFQKYFSNFNIDQPFRLAFSIYKNSYLAEFKYNTLILGIYNTIEKNWISRFKYTMNKLFSLERNQDNTIKKIEIDRSFIFDIFNLVLFNNRTEMLKYLIDKFNILEYFYNYKPLEIKVNRYYCNDIDCKADILYIFKQNYSIFNQLDFKRRYCVYRETKQFKLSIENFIILSKYVKNILHVKYNITGYEQIENDMTKFEIMTCNRIDENLKYIRRKRNIIRRIKSGEEVIDNERSCNKELDSFHMTYDDIISSIALSDSEECYYDYKYMISRELESYKDKSGYNNGLVKEYVANALNIKYPYQTLEKLDLEAMYKITKNVEKAMLGKQIEELKKEVKLLLTKPSKIELVFSARKSRKKTRKKRENRYKKDKYKKKNKIKSIKKYNRRK